MALLLNATRRMQDSVVLTNPSYKGSFSVDIFYHARKRHIHLLFQSIIKTILIID